MEQSDKIFGVSCTTSAVQSFSGVAASRLSFAAVTTATTVTVASFSSVFGQSPVFTANANSTISSTLVPFASFNFSAPSFPPQNSGSGPSNQNISKPQNSEVQLLFGKPVHDQPQKEQIYQEVKISPQKEPKRRWNTKPGNYSLWYLQKYMAISAARVTINKFDLIHKESVFILIQYCVPCV